VVIGIRLEVAASLQPDLQMAGRTGFDVAHGEVVVLAHGRDHQIPQPEVGGIEEAGLVVAVLFEPEWLRGSGVRPDGGADTRVIWEPVRPSSSS
jgi:hypothetical protein